MAVDRMIHDVGAAAPHGGNLDRARARFGEGDWQDLSTGISPWPWPVPTVPASIWQRLPEQGARLREAAAGYYGVETEQVLALPGSQFGIARLPHHAPPGRVALPVLGYAEHERSWVAAGHEPVPYESGAGLESLLETQAVDHLVLINPNNPTAERLPLNTLQRWLTRMPAQGVALVDEAFADLTPHCSAVPLLKEFASLWVLRSVGKFFGLAGVRLGFLLGRHNGALRRALESELQPWGVSHLAQWVGAKVLADEHWQQRQRDRVTQASCRLERIWQDYLSTQYPQLNLSNGGLFVTLRGPTSVLRALHEQLARRHLWLRIGDDDGHCSAWLRCGLPPDDGRRLAAALGAIGIDIEEKT